MNTKCLLDTDRPSFLEDKMKSIRLAMKGATIFYVYVRQPSFYDNEDWQNSVEGIWKWEQKRQKLNTLPSHDKSQESNLKYC